jgi:pilus assembly protein CpaB
MSLRWLQMRRRPVSAALAAFAVVIGASTVLDRHDPARQAVVANRDISSDPALSAADLLVPVRLADPAISALLQPGDLISVMASAGALGSPATIIAGRVRVVTVSAATNGGLGQGPLIIVATDARGAALLAGASEAALTVVIHPG